VFAADVTDGHAIRTLRLVKAGDRVVEDPLGFLVDPRSVIVTDVLAARLGLHVDDRLRLRTPAGIEAFTVRGILPPGGVGRAFGGNLLVMDVVGAQAVLGLDGRIDQIDVTLDPGVRVDDVEARVRAVLPPGLEALRPARRGEQIERYLRSFQTLLSGLSGLALLAAIFVIGSAVATSVAARRPELAILRCTGATRRQVAGVVVVEAVALGVVGAALGLGLGLVLARVLLRTVSESTELIFAMEVFTTRLEVPPRTLVVGAATGIASALVAAWLPARDAILVSPLAAVRAGRDTRGVGRWRPRTPRSSPRRSARPPCGPKCVSTRRGAATSPRSPPTSRSSSSRCARGAGRRVAPRPVRAPSASPAGSRSTGSSASRPAGARRRGARPRLGLMLTAATVATSFEESVLGFIRRQVRADLVVASSATTGWIEAPVDESLADRLREVPGVERVERVRLAEHAYRGARISIDSLDASAFAPERRDDFEFAAGDRPRRSPPSVPRPA
jgi:putative ABC transport system permease protein